jgi:hypothetical protein
MQVDTPRPSGWGSVMWCASHVTAPAGRGAQEQSQRQQHQMPSKPSHQPECCLAMALHKASWAVPPHPSAGINCHLSARSAGGHSPPRYSAMMVAPRACACSRLSIISTPAGNQGLQARDRGCRPGVAGQSVRQRNGSSTLQANARRCRRVNGLCTCSADIPTRPHPATTRRTCALSHHESIAVGVPGAARPLRLVVALAQGSAGHKAAQAYWYDGGLAAAGNHDIGVARADVVGSCSRRGERGRQGWVGAEGRGRGGGVNNGAAARQRHIACH